MMNIEKLTGEIFEAVRNDSEIGRGTCSYVDECNSDEELKGDIRDCLEDEIFFDVQGGIEWYKRLEGIHAEREQIAEMVLAW